MSITVLSHQTRARRALSRNDAGAELFDSDQWLDRGLDVTLDEVPPNDVVTEHIANSTENHGLVQGQVTLGDDYGLDRNRVIEAALAIRLELVLDLDEVVEGLDRFVLHGQERRVWRDNPVAPFRFGIHSLSHSVEASVVV